MVDVTHGCCNSLIRSVVIKKKKYYLVYTTSIFDVRIRTRFPDTGAVYTTTVTCNVCAVRRIMQYFVIIQCNNVENGRMDANEHDAINYCVTSVFIGEGLIIIIGRYYSCGISPNDIFRPLRLYKTCKIRCTQTRHAPDIWIESTSSYPSSRYIIYYFELPLNQVCSKWSIERVYSATVPSTGNLYFVCETYETTVVTTNTITGRTLSIHTYK